MIKINSKTYKDIDYFASSKRKVEHDKNLLYSLICDLKELNDLLSITGYENCQITIEYENNHTEYSPERVDPCPDFYGMFILTSKNNNNETIGDIMTIDELDQALFIIIEFYKNLINKK